MRYHLSLGALLGALAVALGAFGAHALRGMLAPEFMAIYEKATYYQLAHAIALALVGVLGERAPRPGIGVAGTLFLVGIVLFSGSLYLIALTGIVVLGAITPLGGLCFMAGWLMLARAAWPVREDAATR